MRMSDWSSDVCSSDLSLLARRAGGTGEAGLRPTPPADCRRNNAHRERHGSWRLPFPWTTLLVVPGIDDLLHGGPEIRFVAGHELQPMDVRGGRHESVHHADRPARCASAREHLAPAIGNRLLNGYYTPIEDKR